MRFGFMEDFRNPVRWRIPFPEFYQAIFDQVVRAEALGYDNVWLTEHHFTEDAYNPASLATAAALAVRTSRIRIGTFVLLLPFINPVRAAEDVALADILSNGRFDLGIGQGYSHYEWDAFCMNRSERGVRMREALAIMKRLFTEERVSHDGRYTRIKDMTLSPKPVQQPHPPVWIGARAPQAIRRAAEMGHHLMATLGPDPAPLYLETLKACGRDPAAFKICQLRMVYCADTEAQAWEDCQHHLWHLFQYYHDVLSEAKDAAGDDAPLPVARAEDIRHSPMAEGFMIGTPDQVARKLEAFCQQFHCTDFIMASQYPGMDPRKSTRSMELFAREVMPEFRDA